MLTESSLRTFQPQLVPPSRGVYQFNWRDHPVLDVEIGPGVGLHPLRYAGLNPNRTVLAIEHSRERFQKFARRLQNHPKLNNLYIFHEDAQSFFVEYLAPNSIDRLFILYPNPYPKKSQKNLRFHASCFSQFLVSCLKPGGELFTATNEQTYALECEHYWQEQLGLKLVQKNIISKNFLPTTYRALTHFEKKYLDRNQNCFHLTFRKPLPN